MQLPAAPYKGHWLKNQLLTKSPYNPACNRFPQVYKSGPRKPKRRQKERGVESGSRDISIPGASEQTQEISDTQVAAHLLQNVYCVYSQLYEDTTSVSRVLPGEGMSSPEMGTSPSRRLAKMQKKIEQFQEQKAAIKAKRALVPLYKKQIARFVSLDDEPQVSKSRTFDLQDGYRTFEAKMRESEALAATSAKKKDLTLDLRLVHHTFAPEPDVPPVLLFAHLPPHVPHIAMAHKTH